MRCSWNDKRNTIHCHCLQEPAHRLEEIWRESLEHMPGTSNGQGTQCRLTQTKEVESKRKVQSEPHRKMALTQGAGVQAGAVGVPKDSQGDPTHSAGRGGDLTKSNISWTPVHLLTEQLHTHTREI